jgi:pilus assembly protein CpaB
LKRRVLAVTVAILLAVVATIAVLAYAKQANNRAVAGLKAETVYVAKSTIPAGTKVSDAQLSTEHYPVGSLPPNPVTSLSGQEGKIINTALQPNEILLQSSLVTSSQYSGLSSSGLAIPKNQMAVTVQVCLAPAVAGYIQPGAWVSLFDTWGVGGTSIDYTCTSHQLSGSGSGGGSSSGKADTGLVLTHVQVLAVQAASGSNGPTGVTAGLAAADPTAASSTVTNSGQVLLTIAVTEAQAKWLILVGYTGDPVFGLLAPGYVPNTDPIPATGPPMPSLP